MRHFLLLTALFLALIAIVAPKFVLPLTKHKILRQPSSKASSMSQPIIDYFDDFYSIQIQLGTPPQNLIVRFDSGSANFWVMDKAKCTEPQCNGEPSLTSNYNRTLFDSTKSSTYATKNVFFNSSQDCYQGKLATDMFSLAGYPPIKQTFGNCFDVNKFMGLHPFDGFMGLSWPSLAFPGLTPIMQNEVASGNFNKALFSVYLKRDNHGISYNSGAVTWNGMDTTNCNTNVQWNPVNSQQQWQFTIDSFSMGSYSYSKSAQAISSTGEAILVVPSTVMSNIVKITNATFFPIIDGAQYVVPCDKAKNMPPLVYTIEGTTYTIPFVDAVDPLDPILNNTCAFRIETPAGGAFGPQWVFGAPFLRNYCAHYDFDNFRIGFSKSKP